MVCFTLPPRLSPPSLSFHSPHQSSPFDKVGNPTVRLCPSTNQKSHAIAVKINSNSMTSSSEDQTKVQSFIDLLRHYAKKGMIGEGKTTHGFLLKSTLIDENADKEIVLFNHLAYVYVKCSNMTYARRLFDKMPERNVFSWTIMIVGSTENGLFLDGFRLFCEMQEHGIRPDKFAYTTLIQSCIGLESLRLGKMVHAQIIKSNFSMHVFVNTSLVNMYAKLGEIEDSVGVFKAMNEHSPVSWNAMISGYSSNGLDLEAYDHFIMMRRKGFEPNIYTFASVLKAIGRLGDVPKGREVHMEVLEFKLESHFVVGTALIDMYSKCRCLSDARAVFDNNFTHCNVNTPWNAMISGYCLTGYSEEALKIFNQMCLNDVPQDLFTYGSVFSACANLKCQRSGRTLHARVLKYGDALQVLNVNNAVADAYAKCGCVEDAENVFKGMKERDVVSWTTMVTAYVQCSQAEKAVDIFSQMRKDGVIPNEFTFASVLVGCASLCLLEFGRQVHGLLSKMGLGDSDCVESALIDMYAKCGSITEAEKIFKKISSPDVVSWTALLSGYAQHGFTNTALQFFKIMEQSGIKPNAVTMLCVLFACSHGGMIHEGLCYFQSMKERYDIMPDMEHYACVVDLLGRAGRLNDAMEFINDMPIRPTEMIWQTLLGACRVHGNTRLGEIAAREILSVRPDYSATYILLSNTYIETGSLDDGLSLRNVMKERGVKKEPGFSWIAIRGRVHKFFSGDQNHPQKEDIYAKLEELTVKIKAMGYMPDVIHVSEGY